MDIFRISYTERN